MPTSQLLRLLRCKPRPVLINFKLVRASPSRSRVVRLLNRTCQCTSEQVSGINFCPLDLVHEAEKKRGCGSMRVSCGSAAIKEKLSDKITWLKVLLVSGGAIRNEKFHKWDDFCARIIPSCLSFHTAFVVGLARLSFSSDGLGFGSVQLGSAQNLFAFSRQDQSRLSSDLEPVQRIVGDASMGTGTSTNSLGVESYRYRPYAMRYTVQ